MTTMTKFKLSNRLQVLPPYLFVEIDRAKKELIAAGKDVISLAIGDPDLPTPDFIVEALKGASADPKNHQYPLDAGLLEFRQAIAQWFQNRFSVKLEVNGEILPLIGSKEGISHFPLAFLNPGDVSLIPDPGYPPYLSGTIFAGGQPYYYPLLEKNNYLPDFNSFDPEVVKKAKILCLCYPNSPTSAMATEEMFKEAIAFSKKNDLILINDMAYSEIAFGNKKPISLLQIPGAKDVGIEFHSLSKTYNMTGWRIAFACGNSELITGLAKIKSNIDSGVFQAIQVAGITALKRGDSFVSENVAIYKKRRDVMMSGLKKLGIECHEPEATFYIWAKVPGKMTSSEFCMKLLKEAYVVVTPGHGFGKHGEGYFRIALTTTEDRIEEAVKRIAKAIS